MPRLFCFALQVAQLAPAPSQKTKHAFSTALQVAQAHLLCQAAHTLLRRAGMPAVQSLAIQGPAPGEGPVPATPSIPVLVGGDFNSLPYKLTSDQFDAGRQRRGQRPGAPSY
jgi:hypothetical protein